MGVRLDFIDPLRGLAILMVLVHHAMIVVHRETFGVGWLGVAVFFAISGFCIHLSCRKNPSWTEFAVRRFCRIYPPYLLAIIVFVFTGPFYNGGRIWPQLLAVQNLDRDALFGINPSFWSIAVEVQLYAVYPVLLILVRRLGWNRTIVWLLAAELTIRIVNGMLQEYTGLKPPAPLVFTPPGFWFSWAVGAYAAQGLIEGRRTVLDRLWIEPLIVVAIVLSVYELTRLLAFPVVALATAVAIDRLRSGRWTMPRGLPTDLMSSVGLISYSLYLVHQPILHLVPNINLALLLSFGSAWVFWRWVEVPSNRAGRHASTVYKAAFRF